MKTAYRFIGIVAVGVVLLLPAPYYAESITGGSKRLDALIVSIIYVIGAVIINQFMPKYGEE